MNIVVEKAAARASQLLKESAKYGASDEAIRNSGEAEETFEKVKGELKENFPRFKDVFAAQWSKVQAVQDKTEEVQKAAEGTFAKLKVEAEKKANQAASWKTAQILNVQKKAAEEQKAQSLNNQLKKVHAEKKAAEEKEAQALKAAQALNVKAALAAAETKAAVDAATKAAADAATKAAADAETKAAADAEKAKAEAKAEAKAKADASKAKAKAKAKAEADAKWW